MKLSPLMFSFLTSLVVLVLTFVILVRRSRVAAKEEEEARGRGELPKGTLGWPIIGESLGFMSSLSSSSPERFVDDRCNKYGKIFKTHLFGSKTIMSVDPTMNRWILHGGADAFVPAYPRSVMELMGEESILMVNGSSHRRVHGLVGGFLKSHELKSQVTHNMQTNVLDCMEGWEDGSVVFLQDVAKEISFGLLVKTLMGLEMGSDQVQLLKQRFQEFTSGFMSLPIKIPGFTFHRSLKAKSGMIEFVGNIIKARRENNYKELRDVIDVLLDSQSDNEIIHNIIDFMVPGEDSVPTLITLAVKFLSDTPDALKQLEEENMKLKMEKEHSRENLEASDFLSLTFTQDVISETLRMANIVNGVYRKAMKDMDFQGYLIPKGWTVFAYFRGVHLRKDIYQDPYKFNPWRWQNKEMGGGCTFTPFGGGLRLCPGMEMARLEAAIFLHHLVTRFKWFAHEDTVISFPLVRMKGRMPIKVQRKAVREA